MHAETPWTTIGFYAVLVLLLLFAASRAPTTALPLLATVLIALLMLFLARFLTTSYTLDHRFLRARRLFGSRRISLEEVRRIEYANLRDLGPVSFFGGWGWRGRMWSPVAGTFDSISTISRGLLVTAGRVPLFVSPKDPKTFARELSRRVRSYHEQLDADVGRD